MTQKTAQKTGQRTGPGADLGLYIHVPFCTVKCAYCDFNSYSGIEDLEEAWARAAERELELWAPRARGRELATVFFGGGTPSLIAPAAIAGLLEAARRWYALADDAEITLEANPESVSGERAAAWREAGVNRVSMGVQSLNSSELLWLDRIHGAERAREAFGELRSSCFENVNVDLIYGLPGQSAETWQRTLEEVLGWGSDGRGPEHLSCYALTVEEGTPLASRVAAGAVREADADHVAELADWTARHLAAAGYQRYETSNYARAGRECRHNLNYWRLGEYIAVGPGAHGFIDGVRYSVVRRPRAYIERVLDGCAAGLPSPAVEEQEAVEAEDAAVDFCTLGLRLTEGIDLSEAAERWPDQMERLRPAVDWALAERLAEQDGGRLRLTARGHALANEVFVRFVDPSLV